MGNTTGVGGAIFQSYVAILNPTASTIPVNVTLYDPTGTKHDATISLAAGEQKTYSNFLDAIFQYTGGGSVVFSTAETPGGTHNNRFIVTHEIRTNTNGQTSTLVPPEELGGTGSRSFAAGINVDSATRTNIGCHNLADTAQTVKATAYDAAHQAVGTFNITLAPRGWGQTAVTSVVSNGYVQFEPTDPALCYAVVVNNTSNDGRYISAVEYQP